MLPQLPDAEGIVEDHKPSPRWHTRILIVILTDPFEKNPLKEPLNPKP